MTFDLIIKNGRIIDPAQKLDQVLDVGVKNGKITALSAGLEAKDTQVLDATNKLVTPGLIDIHVHASEHVGGFNVPPDVVGVKMGATTVVDAGSCGILGLSGFQEVGSKQCQNENLSPAECLPALPSFCGLYYLKNWGSFF